MGEVAENVNADGSDGELEVTGEEEVVQDVRETVDVVDFTHDYAGGYRVF